MSHESSTDQKKKRTEVPPDSQLTGIELHEISEIRHRAKAKLGHLWFLHVREPMSEEDREDYRRACEEVEEERDRLIVRVLA